MSVPGRKDLPGLRAEVRAFLAAELGRGTFTPQCDSWLTGFDPDFSHRLAEHGWVGMTLPKRFGGAGASAIERFVVVEELLAAGAPVAAHWFAERQVGPSLLRNGTARQQERWLPQITAGTACFAIGLSEADAGSDLAAVRTRATPTPSGWRLNGSKLWSSGAHRATAMVVLARTAPDVEGVASHAGLTQFLVTLPDPRVHISPILSMSGEHHFNEVVFDDLDLGDDAVLGTAGQGWSQVIDELAYERSGPERFLSSMPVLAEFLGQVDANDPQELDDVGWLVAQLVALRELSWDVARRLDDGLVPAASAALVKDLGTHFEQAAVDRIASAAAFGRPGGSQARRLLGRALVQSPNSTLRGGTSEILRGVIARQGLDHVLAAGEPSPQAALVAETVTDMVGRTEPALDRARDPLWVLLAETGLDRAGMPEAAGGFGGSLGDTLAVLNVTAASGRSTPVGAQVLVAGWLAEQAGLKLPDGLVLPIAGCFGGETVQLAQVAGGWRAWGSAEAVPFAGQADALLAVGPTGRAGRWAVAVLDPGQWTLRPGSNLGGEARDGIDLRGIELGDVTELPAGVDRDSVFCRFALAHAAAIAAALAGVCDLTWRYAGQRHQFGKPIASFQAVRDHLVVMAEETAAAQAATRVALETGSILAIAAAKARCGQAVRHTVRRAHQVHGAIGTTAEYPLGRFSRQLWSWAGEFGDTRYWQRRIGSTVVAGRAELFDTVLAAFARPG